MADSLLKRFDDLTVSKESPTNSSIPPQTLIAAVAPPKPTFLTLPVELRKKIYGHALKTDKEFRVRECPEDYQDDSECATRSARRRGAWGSVVRETELPELQEHKTTNQSKDLASPSEQTDGRRTEGFRVANALPGILRSCLQLYFMEELYYPPLVLAAWAFKVKLSADPNFDTEGKYGSIGSDHLHIGHIPDSLDDFSLELVPQEEHGYHPPTRRDVEFYFEKMMASMCLIKTRIEGTSGVLDWQSMREIANEKETLP